MVERLPRNPIRIRVSPRYAVGTYSVGPRETQGRQLVVRISTLGDVDRRAYRAERRRRVRVASGAETS